MCSLNTSEALLTLFHIHVEVGFFWLDSYTKMKVTSTYTTILSAKNKVIQECKQNELISTNFKHRSDELFIKLTIHGRGTKIS